MRPRRHRWAWPVNWSHQNNTNKHELGHFLHIHIFFQLQLLLLLLLQHTYLYICFWYFHSLSNLAFTSVSLSLQLLLSLSLSLSLSFSRSDECVTKRTIITSGGNQQSLSFTMEPNRRAMNESELFVCLFVWRAVFLLRQRQWQRLRSWSTH